MIAETPQERMDENDGTEETKRNDKKRKKEVEEKDEKSKKVKKCKKSKESKRKHHHIRSRYAAKVERKDRYCDRLDIMEVVDICLSCIGEFEHLTQVNHGINSSVQDQSVLSERFDKWRVYIKSLGYSDYGEMPDVRKIVKDQLVECAYQLDVQELNNEQSEDSGEVIGAVNDPHLFTMITDADVMDFIYMLWDTKDEVDMEVLARRAHTGGVLRPSLEVRECFFRILCRILHKHKYFMSESESSDSESDGSDSQENSPSLDDSTRAPSPKRTCLPPFPRSIDEPVTVSDSDPPYCVIS